MTTWFTSDLHFGHESIIKFCKRPWTNTTDMDLVLLENWNSRIEPTDIVWFLGDFSFHRDEKINRMLLNELHGVKNLILGNHDKHVKHLKEWESVQTYKEMVIDNKFVTLFHYPMVDWNGRFRGSYHLYGHTHARYNPLIGEKAMDVGVDSNAYFPVSFEQVVVILENGWQGPSGWQNAKDADTTVKSS